MLPLFTLVIDMGLFSSKKETYVGTSVSRVIQDRDLPDFAKTGVLKAIMEASGTISDYLMEEAVASIAVKVDSYYRYGQTAYSYGLPTGEMYSNLWGMEEIQVILDTLVGAPVLIEYLRYGPPNIQHIGWKSLVEDHGYDSRTNTLANLSDIKDTPVYLKDLEVVIPAAQAADFSPISLERWGIPPKAGYTPERPANTGALGNLIADTPVRIDDTISEEVARATYTWKVPGEWAGGGVTPPSYPNGVITIPVTGFDDDADYFQVKYSHEGKAFYWMYEVGTGVYPELDALFGSNATVMGDYFPFLYFRYGKQSMSANTGSQEFITSKRMAKYLGMDYETIIDAIHENPDIDQVEQAMCIFAVPAKSQDPLDLKYLYEYFDRMYYFTDITFSVEAVDDVFQLLSKETKYQRSSNVIQDARFKMTLNTGGIFKQRLAGVLGPVGTHTGEITTRSKTVKTVNRFDEESTRTVQIPCHVYRKQISDGLYDEVQVLDLQMFYFILGKHTAIGDETDDILLVPIDRSITEGYEFAMRERLYARSLHFVFNSVEVVNVKWYQQEWFSDFLLIVAIVVTIFTLGADGGTFISAVLSGTIALPALLYIIAVKVMTFLIIREAIKLFVKAVGMEVAFIVAIIAAAFGMYAQLQGANFQGLPWVKDLLQLSSGLVKQISQSVADNMEDLLGEAKGFSAYVDEQVKSLETAKELLETNNFLSPFVIFGETPDDYYQRTVHSGNIGVVGIGVVASYVEIALTLPKLKDSVGDTFYG